ncbi:hypothetical protein V473_10950 [Sphingobium cupriresistens LL01]|uniref:Uncharacterized protein n=1 Tax=Sphingobium cupriresistens LL01 TaxID=1420583 RepID=A0A0J7Y4M0_9SPHN|nr:hypothetical protein V473_10950 [Sphingobium cupriresistens LL01]
MRDVYRSPFFNGKHAREDFPRFWMMVTTGSAIDHDAPIEVIADYACGSASTAVD